MIVFALRIVITDAGKPRVITDLDSRWETTPRSWWAWCQRCGSVDELPTQDTPTDSHRCRTPNATPSSRRNLWTSAEDDIIASHTLTDAAQLLPHRTLQAIRNRHTRNKKAATA